MAQPTRTMIAQAAEWSAQLATDEASRFDRDACEAWCREHPLHRMAMDRMRGFDAQIDATDDCGRAALRGVFDERARKVRRIGGGAFAVALLAGSGWLAAQSMAVQGLFPDHATGRGEQHIVQLDDGSAITLDTDAAIDVDHGRESRGVTLFQGQLLAKVARDPGRPFVVRTRDGTATALGTAYTVRKDDDATRVTVLESRVRVCPAGQQGRACVDLGAGERAQVTSAGVARLTPVDPGTAGSWAEGWLVADDRSVVEVLRELDRYRESPVHYDDADLAGVRVSGSFPLTEPDRALDAIAQATGLHLTRAADGSARLRR